MVRTRNNSHFVDLAVDDNSDGEDMIQGADDFHTELKKEYNRIRWVRSQKMVKKTLRSPRKVCQKKQKLKTKQQLEGIKQQLLDAKKNLSKAEDRILPNPPVQQPTVREQIHEKIRNGEAKRNLRPVVIVIDD